MMKQFTVQWEGRLPATAQQTWEAVTAQSAGWLWHIEYEPRVGGAERGLSAAGGTVTRWEPPRRLTTRAPDGDGVNELDYRLLPRGDCTHLRYVHHGVLAEADYDRELDACRAHTAFYYHSLGEYLGHFAGRAAAYVAADAPGASARAGFAALRRALGIRGDVTVGDRVRLAPAGLAPVEGVVDYANHAFLGIRSADALYRFYGRDAWGWPVGVAHHLFADGVDAAATRQRWSGWLADVFATEAVA